MAKTNSISQHRQLARKAIREQKRREEGCKPNGWSDAAIKYMIERNPGAAVTMTGRGEDKVDLLLGAFGL